MNPSSGQETTDPFAPTLIVATARDERVEANPLPFMRATQPVSSSDLVGREVLLPEFKLESGDVIKQYEIIRELGRGGMGRVFLARDTRLARLCAIKVLLSCVGLAGETLLHEARATAHCVHEHIVVVYEVDEYCGFPYMVLEYLKGRTLRFRMNERGAPLPEHLAIDIMIPVVKALICAHELGIVHRDLKPENILMTDLGQVKVLDFGIAKQVARPDTVAHAEDVTMANIGSFAETSSGALIGTLPYMSPEQLAGAKIDAQCDIWAVGIILHEVTTGKYPLDATDLNWFFNVQDLDIAMPSVRKTHPSMGALGDVIDQCLKKRKTERIASARELLDKLEALVVALPAAEITVDNPFAGLAAFQESDAARFFGRTRDVAAILGRLRQQQMLVVAGPSGAGKSSLIRAGVIPALKRSEERWEAIVFRPGRKPLSALANILEQLPRKPSTESRASSSESNVTQDDHEATLRSRPGHAGMRLREHCRGVDRGRHVLLFVDQFEELYTLGADPDERATFLACLEGIADDASSPLRIIFAIRSDFLDRLTDNQSFAGAVTQGLVLLAPVGREGLHEALTRPVEAAGYRFENENLVKEILDELEKTRSPLPLLQFAGTKLWESRDQERKLILHDEYIALGGVAGALSVHADTVISTLSTAEQRLVRSMLLRLVTPEHTRAIGHLAELLELSADTETAERVIAHLANARLLLIESSVEHEGTTVELVHESLIERWSTLRQWLEESHQDAAFLSRLRSSAKQWQASGEAEGLVWRDRTARDAQVWLERRRVELGANAVMEMSVLEKRFLTTVVNHFERTQRRRKQQLAGLIGMLVAVTVVISYLAFRAQREAENAREEALRRAEQASRADAEALRAQTEARQARNATRISVAREWTGDPTTMLAILRQVEPPEVPRGWAELTKWALQQKIARVVITESSRFFDANFSPDGRHIVAASGDKTVRIYNSDGLGEALVLRGHTGNVMSVDYSRDGKRIVSASGDKTARVWNADGTGEPLVFSGHRATLYSAAFSPDGTRIVTGSSEGVVRVWDVGETRTILEWNHKSQVYWAAFSPDGERIVSATVDGVVHVMSLDKPDRSIDLRGHEFAATSAMFSPDGKRIVSTSDDKTVRVRNADGSGEPLVLRGHKAVVNMAMFSPDGKRILSGSEDKTARLWNADGSGQAIVFSGHQDAVNMVHFDSDGGRIITAAWDNSLRVWDAQDERSPIILYRGMPVEYVAYSADGKRILVTARPDVASVWNADGSGKPVALRGHEHVIVCGAFSPDGRHIVTSSLDGTVRLWNTDGTVERVLIRIAKGGGHVTSVAYSSDGRTIIGAAANRMVRIWNSDGTGEPRSFLAAHDDWVNFAEFSPDGKQIVTAARDGTVRVWDAAGFVEVRVFRVHNGIVNWAGFSPDGKYLLSAGIDETTRLWRADGTGQPRVLEGHMARFSPDGTRIATATKERTIKIWRMDGTGEPAVLPGHEDSIFVLAWSPDGRNIVTGSADGTARVWRDLEPLHSVDDPVLWKATRYCIPAERQMQLLNISETLARAQQNACERHVEAAFQ